MDHGANLVLGHHPHVVQGSELYKNVNIYYSLGHLLFSNFNYITEGMKKWRKKIKLGFLLEVSIENQSIKELNLSSIYQNDDFSVELIKEDNQAKNPFNISDLNNYFKLEHVSYKKFWINYHYDIINKKLVTKAKGWLHFRDGIFKLFKRLLRILFSISFNYFKRKLKLLSKDHL